MIDEEDLLLASVTQVLKARAAKSAAPESVWRSLSDPGYLSVGAADGNGDLQTAAHVARLCAGFVETAELPVGLELLVNPWLRRTAGLASVSHPSTVAVVDSASITPAGSGYLVSAVAERVPWATTSESILLVAYGPGGTSTLVELSRSDFGVGVEVDPVRVACATGRVSAASTPVGGHRVMALSDSVLGELRLRQHLAVVMQLAGLLDGILALSIQFVRDRRQFGKAIGDFQMVKSSIALLAEEATLANGAALAAAAAANRSVSGAALQIRAARAFAGQAAPRASRIAHQIHGAIGMTAEYPLHRFTRQLWHLCDLGLPSLAGDMELGRLVTAGGAASFWSALVGEPQTPLSSVATNSVLTDLRADSPRCSSRRMSGDSALNPL